MNKTELTVLLLLGTGCFAQAQTLAERLASSYTAVTSMTCTIRREIVTEGNEALHLSRVWFARPDKLRVEASLPVARKIVADGSDLFYHIGNDARGLCRPIEDLREDMRIEIRRVPGTPMEHLLRLPGLPEISLPPTQEWRVRAGYDTGRAFITLNLDAQGRLARVEVFENSKMERRLGLYNYGAFREIQQGLWLACRQDACFQYGGREIREITRVENPVVNEDIAANMFDASQAFSNIVFSSDGELAL